MSVKSLDMDLVDIYLKYDEVSKHLITINEAKLLLYFEIKLQPITKKQ